MKHLSVLIFLFLVLGCTTKSRVAEECSTIGIVKDFEGLDGCGLLIKLENGDLLNPLKLPEGNTLEAEQVIVFDYNVLEDMMSICMAEQYQVEITCLKILSDAEAANYRCADTDNPFEVDWMDRAIDYHNPNQIIKFRDGKRWKYLFNAIPISYLYDCEGKLICETRNDHDECHNRYIVKYGKGKVIWEGEGVWD